MAKLKEQVSPTLEDTKGQSDEAVINASGEAGVDDTSEATDVAIVSPKKSALVTMADLQSIALADAEEDLNFTKDDVAIPFLRVLQSNSPQVKKQNAKYVVGAEAGLFFNTATNRLWETVYAIPVWFARQATLWLPRGEGGGGGFVAELPLDRAMELLKQCERNDKNKDITPPIKMGNMQKAEPLELSIAGMYYLVVFNPEDPGEFETLAFPLTSTQMKKAKMWNALIKNARLPNPHGGSSYRPAMYGYAYKLTTVPENNTKGDWMGVKITAWAPLLAAPAAGQPLEEKFPGAASLYMAARDFEDLVKTGKVVAKAVEVEDDGGSMGSEEDGPTPF